MGKLKQYLEQNEHRDDPFADCTDEQEIQVVDDSDDDGIGEVDLRAPINFHDTAEVLKRIFAVVERSTTGDDSAWFAFLTDWDRRFVLNLYDRHQTTGKCPLSIKQAIKATVILRKMMTPVSGRGQGQ